MPPIHDVDVLLLLAVSLAAKRRPAELADLMAAIDLIQGNIPSEDKLNEAAIRLGHAGLLEQTGQCLGLTRAAETLVTSLPRKGEHELRLFELRGLLGNWQPTGEPLTVTFSPADFRQAILAHRSAGKGSAKNLLMPKPAPETRQPKPGQRQRKPMPPARKRPR